MFSIILIVVVIVVVIVIRNKNKNDELARQAEEEAILKANQKLMSEFRENLHTKWALCVRKYASDSYLKPCIIHILEENGKKVALRYERNFKEVEQLFIINYEQENESGSYSWTGREIDTNAFNAISIDKLKEDEKEKHPSAKCSLTTGGRPNDIKFYIVLDFIDFEDGIKTINAY